LQEAVKNADGSREAAEECSPWRKPGWAPANVASPGGAEDNAAYIGEHLVAFHFLGLTTPSVDQTRIPRRFVRISRRDCSRDEWTALIINREPDHVHMLVPLRPAHSAAEIARVGKAKFITLDARETFDAIWMADRVWRVQR